jgi:hypothetical protein
MGVARERFHGPRLPGTPALPIEPFAVAQVAVIKADGRPAGRL